MLTQTKLWLTDRRTRLWFTPAVTSLAAILLALGAAVFNQWVPDNYFPNIERETLDDLLSVIASSMLAVTTFSLGIMVSAFAYASGSVTPRATELVMGDEGTRVAIASFLGAFIFSLIAKIALGLGYYGQAGRFILFVGTVLVLLYLIITLIRWVRTLSSLGLLGNTLAKIEKAAQTAIDDYRAHASMGALNGPEQPAAGSPILADAVGYLRHIDLPALNKLGSSLQAPIHIRTRPGDLIGPDTVLAIVASQIDADTAASVRQLFIVSQERSYDQDPRFGLLVLSETAQRALSPATNDPGTAIQAMTIMTRLLVRLGQPADEQQRQKVPQLPYVTLLPLHTDCLIHDGFDPIARDGAGLLEVLSRMQQLLAMIASATPALQSAARTQAATALAHGERSLPLPQDVQRLRELHQQLHDPAAH